MAHCEKRVWDNGDMDDCGAKAVVEVHRPAIMGILGTMNLCEEHRSEELERAARQLRQRMEETQILQQYVSSLLGVS